MDIGADELIAGDFNRDGDVDSDDLEAFQACQSGPAVALAAGCEGKDLDHDGDVDQEDLGLLQRSLTGRDVQAARALRIWH